MCQCLKSSPSRKFLNHLSLRRILKISKFSQILDLYLQPGYEKHLASIQHHAMSGTEADMDVLRKYVLEGGRLAGTFGLYRKANIDFNLQDGDRNLNLRRDDTVFINFVRSSSFCNPINHVNIMSR